MSIGKLRLSKQWLVIISLAVITAGIWYRVLCPNQTLRAVFLDVGQGDSILLETPSGKTVLIDGGGRPGGTYSDTIGLQVIEPVLRREGINRIDVLVLTHPHDDHVEGLPPVLRDFRVGMVLAPDISCESESYEKFLSLVKSRRIPYKRAERGQVLDFGDGVRAMVLNPPAMPIDDDPNDGSIVLRFVYGESELLLTGDAGIPVEDDIMTSGICVRSDVLKVAHHGSKTSTSDEWLDAVHPRMAVISVGKDNSFGHPAKEVLDDLSEHGAKTYRTDRNGSVFVRFSPKSFSIKTAKAGL